MANQLATYSLHLLDTSQDGRFVMAKLRPLEKETLSLMLEAASHAWLTGTSEDNVKLSRRLPGLVADESISGEFAPCSMPFLSNNLDAYISLPRRHCGHSSVLLGICGRDINIEALSKLVTGVSRVELHDMWAKNEAAVASFLSADAQNFLCRCSSQSIHLHGNRDALVELTGQQPFMK